MRARRSESEGSILRSSRTATASGLRSHFGGVGKDESGGPEGSEASGESDEWELPPQSEAEAEVGLEGMRVEIRLIGVVKPKGSGGGQT
jgi:hypothetical protein